MHQIETYLKSHRLYTDGAMGTYYEQLTGRTGLSEYANLSEPEQIEQIHLEYIDNGANLIRTNTFAVNSAYFEDASERKKSIQAAMKIARRAVERRQDKGQQVFIGADIGPVNDTGESEPEQVLQEYREICDAFLEVGADCFVFETHSDTFYVKEAAAYIKEKKKDTFILAQFAFNRSGYTKLGLGSKRLVGEMENCPYIDAYGFNCGMSSAHLYELVKKQVFHSKKPVSVLPNASYPNMLRGKVTYSSNVDYFVNMMEKISELGIEILGGCCGTTPKHIHMLRQKAEKLSFKHHMVQPEETEKQDITEDISVWKTGGQESVNASVGEIADSPQVTNTFMEKVRRGEKVFVVELDPPFDENDSKVLEGAEFLKKQGVDIITLSDSPLARPRMEVSHMAIKLQREIGIPVMPHIACRDRNVIALRGMFLGLYANGIQNLLLVTGDPIAREDRNLVKPVYDFNSIKLMQYVQKMNEEHFLANKLCYGGALNYHGINPEAIAERMKRKVEAGAEYFLTQPIYSMEDIERIAYLKDRVNTRIFCGIMPLVSYRNAQFIKNEMPGIHVPEEIIEQYREGLEKEEYEKIAVETSVKIGKEMGELADGYYFMTPFNRVHLISEIIKELKNIN